MGHGGLRMGLRVVGVREEEGRGERKGNGLWVACSGVGGYIQERNDDRERDGWGRGEGCREMV
jgi:hypothetical protein